MAGRRSPVAGRRSPVAGRRSPVAGRDGCYPGTLSAIIKTISFHQHHHHRAGASCKLLAMASGCLRPAPPHNPAVLPDADPAPLLDAFLAAHAQGGVATVLYARGEELHRRLANDPPALPAWGRFLVAMGELAAERFDDPTTASRYFLAALQGVDRHGDHEAAVTAGYDQGVLAERLGRGPQARTVLAVRQPTRKPSFAAAR